MDEHDRQHFHLQRPTAPLPREADFDPFGGDLDAQCAWRNFGGLSLQQAHDVFVSAPERHQEHFMFMGSKAFAYYLPVIDRYLREVTGADEGDDCAAAILGSGVAAQFDWKGAALTDSLVREIEDLCVHVLGHLERYSPALEDQKRIRREWSRVAAKAAEHEARNG